MKLKKVRLNNFLSHRDTEIDFSENSKVLINGRSGSGKTAIVEAIIFCFFGKGRLDNRSLVRNGQSSGSVEVHIGDDAHKWVIRRIINSSGSQSLTVSHEIDGKAVAVSATSIKEKQEYIEKEILKCSYDLFVNSVVYPQDSGQNFVRQSATKRKELLLEIVGASDFDKYFTLAKNKKSLLENEINGLNAKIDTNGEHLLSNRNNLKEILKKLGERSIEDLENDLDVENKLISKLEEEKANKEKVVSDLAKDVSREQLAREKIEVLKASFREKIDIGTAEARVTEIEIEERKLDDVQKRVDEEKEKAIRAESLRREKIELEALLREAENKVEDGEKTVSELEKEKSGLKVDENDFCPMTNEVCPKVADVYKKREDAIDEKIKTFREEIRTWKGKRDEILSKIENLETVEVDKDFIDLMEKKLKSIAELKIEKSSLEMSIKNSKEAEEYNKGVELKISEEEKIGCEDHSADLAEENDLLEKIRTNIAASRSRCSDLGEKLAAARAVDNEKSRIESAIRDTEEVISVLSKKASDLTESLKCVNIIREAFGANGIRAVVVDTVLPRLERRINEILCELSDFKIRLDTQKENVSNDGKKEGLFITIINELGEEMNFDGYSGGEKLKIVVSISEALAELQKADFRIIDELFIGLDEESVSQFGGVLMKLQERFSQVLCISHIQSIKDMFEERIEINKVDGVSSCKS